MELIERISTNNIAFLNEMSFSTFKTFSESCKNEAERKVKFDMMKAYCKANVKAKYEVKKIYSFTEVTPNEVGGRLYSGLSVQSLQKDIRALLFRDSTTDIDMKNAHPVILKYICKLHSVMCPNLSYYCEHRSAILENMGEDGKTVFLKAVNHDKLNKKITDSFFKAFDKECKMIQKTITALPCYKHIVDSVPSIRTYNWNGSAINRILCVYENKILQQVIHVCNENTIEICALMFDGLLIYGNLYNNRALIQTIEEKVESHFEGLDMKFAYKQHSDVIQIPEDFIPSVENSEVEGRLYASTDLDASKLVYDLIKDKIVFCQGTLFYLFDHMWISDSSLINELLIKLAMDLQIWKRSTMGDQPFSQYVSSSRNIIIATLCTVKSNPDNGWMKRAQTSSLGKILFTNGYYDGKLSSFISFDNETFDNSIVFWGRIHRDFDSDLDETYLDDIRERFFYQTLGSNAGDFLVLQLARGLMGDMVKQVIFGLGGTNTGKTVLSNAISLSIGDYYGAFNAENLAYSTSSCDEAQKLRFALLLKDKRIIISNEMKSTVEINGNMIKKIASGGDTLIGRKHCSSEEEFVLQGLSFILANDLPKIKPYDDAVDARVRVVSYTKQYVANPSNEFELKRDDNVFNEMKTLHFQQHFVGLLLRSYASMISEGLPSIPESVLQAKSNWVENSDGIIADFAKNFDITNCADDFVVSNDIQEYIKTNGVGVSMTKFGMEMKRYCTIKKLTHVGSICKKIGGKCVQVWTGIKMPVDEF